MGSHTLETKQAVKHKTRLYAVKVIAMQDNPDSERHISVNLFFHSARRDCTVQHTYYMPVSLQPRLLAGLRKFMKKHNTTPRKAGEVPNGRGRWHFRPLESDTVVGYVCECPANNLREFWQQQAINSVFQEKGEYKHS